MPLPFSLTLHLPRHLSRKGAKRYGCIKSIQCRRLPGSIGCINRPGPFQPKLILAIAIVRPDRISVSNDKLLVSLVKSCVLVCFSQCATEIPQITHKDPFKLRSITITSIICLTRVSQNTVFIHKRRYSRISNRLGLLQKMSGISLTAALLYLVYFNERTQNNALIVRPWRFAIVLTGIIQAIIHEALNIEHPAL